MKQASTILSSFSRCAWFRRGFGTEVQVRAGRGRCHDREQGEAHDSDWGELFVMSFYKNADDHRVELNVRFVGERNFVVPEKRK